MLRDITIGQHFPGNSILHTMDPVSYTHLDVYKRQLDDL